MIPQKYTTENLRDLIVIHLMVMTAMSSWAQVIDYTPEGEWTSFETQRIDDGKHVLIEGLNVDGSTQHFILSNNELYSFAASDSLEDVGFLQNVGDTLFLVLKDTSGLRDFVFFYNGQVEEVATGQNWSEGFLSPVEMSDGSLYTELNFIPSGFKHPAVISDSGLTILDGNPYTHIFPEDLSKQDRVYATFTNTTGIANLGYYDIDYGFQLTNIEALGVEILSDNPSDSSHVLILNHTNTVTPSAIYRVTNDTVFTEIHIPGGPYFLITKLYRNDDTNTSLFEMHDFDSNVKLVQRKGGIWTELTPQISGFTSIQEEALIGSQAFFEVRFPNSENELWYFQSIAGGDTLARISPEGETFSFIRYLRNSLLPQVTFELEQSDDEYMYFFFDDGDNLIPPQPVLLNPNDEAATRVDLRENGVYTFDFDTIHQVYHQAFAGAQFVLLTDSLNTLDISFCSSDDFVLLKYIYEDIPDTAYYYNLDTIRKITLPQRDTFVFVHELETVGDDVCILESRPDNLSVDSDIFTYTIIDGQLIDVTHPRWRNMDIRFNTVDYNGEALIGEIQDLEESGTVRLWGVTNKKRAIDNCNSDYKFFQQEVMQLDMSSSSSAREIFIGTDFQLSGDAGISLTNRFEGESAINLFGNSTFESGLNIELAIQDCSNAN